MNHLTVRFRRERRSDPKNQTAQRTSRPWPWTDDSVSWERDRELAGLIAGLLMAAKGAPWVPVAPEHAAVDILVEATSPQGRSYWLTRMDFVGRFITVDAEPEPVASTRPARIDWHAAFAALERGDLQGPAWAERALRLAASTVIGTPVSLRDCLRPGHICAVQMTDAIRRDGQAEASTS